MIRRTVASEWTKLRSVRSTTWSLLAAVALTVVLTAVICASSSTEGCPPGTTAGCDKDIVELSLGGIYFGQLAVVALAVMAISSEYTTRMIRTTFTASPRRRAVLAAKAAVVGGLVLVVGLATSLASFFFGQALLAGNGYTEANGFPAATLTDGPTLRAVVGSGLYLGVVALLSLGIGAILRHTAAAITTVLGLLWFPLIPISLLPQDVGLEIAKFCPMTAGLAIQRTVEWVESVPISPWAGFGVLCAYAAAALLVALWQVEARDA
jgi:ABC-2 type transport system permease protein